MTLKDLLKRTTIEDLDKTLLFVDRNNGWSNINIKITDTTINILEDTNYSPFSDE